MKIELGNWYRTKTQKLLKIVAVNHDDKDYPYRGRLFPPDPDLTLYKYNEKGQTSCPYTQEASIVEPVDGPIKHDGDKPRMEIIPGPALIEVAKVLTVGATKYNAWNWQKGFIWGRLSGAALRHLFAWLSGEDNDPETGLSHIAHAICCMMFLMDHILLGLGEDDRRGER